MTDQNEDLKQQLKQLTETLRQKEKELYSIERIGQALSSTLHIDELLELIMKEITVLMNAERSTLFVVDKENDEIWSKIALKAEVREIRQKLGKGISGYVAKTGETINIPDAYKDNRFDPTTDKRTGYRTKSILCLPVWEPLLTKRNREIIGVIQVLNKNQGFFGSDDEMLLKTLASQVAISISNSRLYQELESKYKEVDVLYDFEKIISSLYHLPELVTSLLKKTLEHLQAHKVIAIFSIDSKTTFASIDSNSNKDYKIYASIPGVIVDFKSNPNVTDLRNSWVQFQSTFNIQEEISELDEPILFSLIEQSNKKQGVLITFGGEIIAPNNIGDHKKIIDQVSQKVSRALELHRLRQDLLSKERLSGIGQMMSTIVHDIKSPINTIYGFIDLMQDAESTSTERKEYAGIIRHEVNTVLNMITEILDFAKGKTNILPRKTGVRDVMRRFEIPLKQLCEKSNTELKISENSKAIIYVDEEKLVRVFYNISKNAIEAMGKGGKLDLTITDKDGNVEFAFKDNGPGIPEEIKDRLFDSFVSSGKEEGTGLGLAIVKKIIDEHKGKTEICSIKGEGVIF
ncbi:MAG: GAF domain-containing sensor histidine kinase, partial [Planctomycetota bacterium]